MMHIRIKRIAVFMLVMVSVTLSVVGAQRVYAVSFKSPDAADSNYEDGSGTSPVYLEVSNGDGSSLSAPQSTVVIYSRTPNPKVVINNYNHCYDKNGSPIDSSNPSQKTGSDTSFTLYDGGDPTAVRQIASVNNSIAPDSADCEVSLTMNPVITARGGTAAGLGNYYVTRLVTTFTVLNGTNAFSVEVHDQSDKPNGYVSYTNQDNSRFAIGKRPPDGTQDTQFDLKFAVPCDANLASQPPLSWYDADRGESNQPGDIYYELRSRARGSGGAYSQVDIAADRNVGGGDEARSVAFDFKKDREYNWIWHNVSSGNGIQFGIPYNSIFATVNCANYSLTPTLTIDSDTVEPGSVVTASPRVTNGGSTDSETAQWQVSRFTIAAGAGVPNASGGTSNDSPCDKFFKPAPICTVIVSGNQVFKVGDTGLASVDNVVDDLPVGSRICYALSIQPYSQTTTDWRHSAPVCVKIGKKPKVQVWGGDIISRATIRTSTTSKTTGAGVRTFGSWGEYGIFSLGYNKSAASGSGFVGAGATSTNQNSWSALTFANKGGTFGSYVSLPARSAVASYFTNRPSVALPATTLSLSGRTGILRTNAGGDVVINASNITSGRSVIVVAPNARIHIHGNITYANGPFTKIDQIPQVVLIANSIVIEGPVSNVDAWLIATNGINTCDDVASNAKLSASICNVPLMINGPVISASLYLRRTGGSGSGAASGDPAERINLRADAYLWAKTLTSNDGNATTVYSYEVPPRF